LKNYLYGPEKYDFITSLRNIEDYELKPSLKYLEKVNNIYIVFSQEEDKKKETDNTIKKIRTDSNGNITDSSNNNSSSSSNNNSSSAKHKNTKRVKFNLGHKKTKRRKH
jgi:hypothetical protein